MLKILPIMLLSSAQKIAHYAQYYARLCHSTSIKFTGINKYIANTLAY